MNGSEIISFLSTNFPTVMNAVGAVTGGLFTAIFLRHKTDVTEFEKIKACQFKEVADSLLKSGKMTYTEYYKANNFLKVAKRADELYTEMHHQNREQVNDFDWFVRFYEAVGNISNEKMQELWAKILAGEINRPSTFSLRTIDVLKNLSQSDAELFERLCSHSFRRNEKFFIPNYDCYLKRCDISFSDIIKLSEQGLVNDTSLAWRINVSTNPGVVCINKGLLMTQKAKDSSTKTINILNFSFTSVGDEMASINKITASDDDFIAFGNEINQSNKVDFEIHKIINIDDEHVEYEDLNLIGSDNQ